MVEEFTFSPFDLQIYDFFQLSKITPAIYLLPQEITSLQNYIYLLMEEFKLMGEPTNETIAHLLKLFFLKLETYIKQRQITHRADASGLIENFQQLIENRFFEHHRIHTYANELGVTADYLSEQVKTVLGTPPSKLIHQRLLVEAKRLLAHTDLTAAEISYSLGFKDSAYFSRFFKRESNHTPLQFRIHIREKYNNPPK